MRANGRFKSDADRLIVGRRVVMIANLRRIRRSSKGISNTRKAFGVEQLYLHGYRREGDDRCRTVSVRGVCRGPLTPQENRQLAQGVLAASAVSYDARVLDIIVAASDGAPRRRQRGSSDFRPSTMRMSLDWAEETISYWRLLISEEEPTGDRPKLPPGVSPRRSPPRSINSAENEPCLRKRWNATSSLTAP
jgi:hypothetical protein